MTENQGLGKGTYCLATTAPSVRPSLDSSQRDLMDAKRSSCYGQWLEASLLGVNTHQIPTKNSHRHQMAIHSVGNVRQMPLITSLEDRGNWHGIASAPSQAHPMNTQPCSITAFHVCRVTIQLTPFPVRTGQSSTALSSLTTVTHTPSLARHPQTRPSPERPLDQCSPPEQ